MSNLIDFLSVFTKVILWLLGWIALTLPLFGCEDLGPGTGVGVPDLPLPSDDSTEIQVTICETFIFSRTFKYQIKRFPNGDVDTKCEVGSSVGSERLAFGHRFTEEAVCFVDTAAYSMEFYTDILGSDPPRPRVVIDNDPRDVFTTEFSRAGIDAIEFKNIECTYETIEDENWERERVR